jgi:hypothetical protein
MIFSLAWQYVGDKKMKTPWESVVHASLRGEVTSVRTHSDKAYTLFQLGMMMVFTFHFIIGYGFASESQEYTLNRIVAGLEVVEAQVPSLQFDYSSERVVRLSARGSVKTTKCIKGTCAHDNINGYLFLDQKEVIRDMDTGEEQIDPGWQVGFDGKATSRLMRTPDEKEQMRGIIYQGRYAKLLDRRNTPHNGYIRGYSGIPYSKIISEPGNEFRVLGTEKQADGLTVVKLSGTFSNGAGEVTLWICPERSFLPLKFILVRTSNKTKMVEYGTSDFLKLADGSYYPQKIVEGNSVAPPFNAMKIFNISIDSLPQEFFRVKMPPNTHVMDHLNRTSYLVTEKEEDANM